MHFPDRKFHYYDTDLIAICQKYFQIDNKPVNGLVPKRQQGIIWTNDGQFIEAYMNQ